MRRDLPSHMDDAGAAAVEFALVLIPLMMILLGIFQLGLIWNTQIQLSGAAKQAARWMAITNDAAGAKAQAQLEAPTANITNGEIAVSGTCPPGATNDVIVVITRTTSIDVRVVPAINVTVTGRGVVRCGG